MSNRLIIDITQLVHWPGRLTGIPRVMNELSLRYKDHSEAIFVVWDHDADSFFELDINKSISLRGQGIFYKETTYAAPKNQMSSKKSTRMQVVDGLKKASAPLKVKQPVLYKKIASRFNKGLRAISSQPVSFESGDVMFVLWGEWADNQYRAQIANLHSIGIKLIHIVYDMLPIVTPQFSGHSTDAMNNYYKEIMPLCDLVLVISKYTKKDLTEWLESQELHVPRIETFRLGDDFALSEPQKPSDGVFSGRFPSGELDYVLCVGTLEARKNHTLLYYTYKLAKERGDSLPKLVIVGRRGWRTDDLFDMVNSDPDIKDDFIFISGASDEELSWLYRNCMFSIYPSFYEGWGLPIAESIAYGKPCISSNTSSMPEVAGDLIDYFSPFSTDECLQSIKKLLLKSNLKSAKDKISTYKPTSWKDTYEEVHKAIKEL